ncbi:MAG: zinc ribbon domain-containing protein [Vicinamibacteria bacterium]
MHCPHCGAPIDPGVRFCPSCRKRVVPPSEGFGMTPPLGSLAPPPPPRTGAPPPPPSYQPAPSSGYQPQVAAALFPPYTVDLRRPGVVTAMAVLNFIGGGFALLGAVAIVFASLAGGGVREPALMAVMGLVYAVFGAGYVAVGVGLLKMKGWARIAQIVLACLGLLSCGIVISVLMLIYLFKPGVKVLFSGKTAEELTAQEAADVAQLSGTSPWMIIVIVLVVGLMMVAIIGIIAAIAIPSLLRARISANESGAIGNLRTIVSAEAAYQSANGGYYDVPACLYAPEPCLRTSAAPRFLDPQSVVFDTPKSGYVLRFHPGETATAPGVSPSSLTAFAVTAEPASPQGGVRAFCIDASGVIYTMAEGDRSPAGGECPQTGRMLR